MVFPDSITESKVFMKPVCQFPTKSGVYFLQKYSDHCAIVLAMLFCTVWSDVS